MGKGLDLFSNLLTSVNQYNDMVQFTVLEDTCVLCGNGLEGSESRETCMEAIGVTEGAGL